MATRVDSRSGPTIDGGSARGACAAALSAATTLAAHVHAGGVTGGWPGVALLAVLMLLLWASAAGRRLTRIGLGGVLVEGQMLGHLGLTAVTVVQQAQASAAVVTRGPDYTMGASTMSGMSGMSPHGMGQMAMSSPVMGGGNDHSMGAMMLACHATAVVVSWLLVMVAEGLARVLAHWLRRVRVLPLADLPGRFRAVMWPVVVSVARPWALHAPNPLRGPPALV